ncbi:TPA: hypothetical protein ACH3X3_007194 [Trebouxia sp. C0006]
MVEDLERCDKCSFIGNKAAMEQHRKRKTPCDAGQYFCRKKCGKPLKSADTRRNHEKTCQGVQATREELQMDNTALQAQLANQVETSNQHMAVASSASVSAVKAVCDIMSKPHKEFDASKLAVHQPVGKETTKHCKGSSLSQHFLNLTPGIDKLVKWFWLLRGQDHPENHNILLVPGDPKHALICREGGWQTCDTDEALFEVFSKDVTMLYDKLGSELCEYAEIHHFKFEYLTHKVMADMNSENRNSTIFKSWQQSITADLSHMTMELYGQEVPSSAAYSCQQAYDSNLQEMEQIQQDVKQLLHRLAVLGQANRTIFMQNLGADA